MSTEPARDVEDEGPWDHRAIAAREPFRQLIRTEQLKPVGTRPPLGEYIAGIWKRRHFLWFDARSRVLTKNSRHRLGAFWLVGKPILDAAFYFIIFGLVLQVDRGLDNYPGFIIIGVLMFRLTTNALNQSAGLIHSSRSMIQAFSFPRASLVISLILRELISAIPILAAVVVMLVLVPPHELPSFTWLLVIPLVLMQSLLNLGAAFLIARAGASFPDVSFGIGFLSRVLMYASGVIFPIDRIIERLGAHPAVYAVITHNPLFVMLEMYRGILLDHNVPPADQWLTLLAWGVGLTVLGFLIFWRSEEKYGRL